MFRTQANAVHLLLFGFMLSTCSDEVETPVRSGNGGTGGAINTPRAGAGTGGTEATAGTTASGGSSADAGTGGVASGGTSASGGSNAGFAGSDVANAPVTLPFAVDDHYVPSGGMGDASIGGPVDHQPNVDCKPRPENAVGKCWKASYRPSAQGWAGFFWQYPLNNWGAQPGLKISAGATSVTFYAASNLEGLTVQFLVGGINDPAQPSHNPAFHFDPYVEKFKPEGGLKTTLTRYTIPLPAKTEAVEVIGGFGWTIGSKDPDQIAIPEGQVIELYLDGIEWN